MKNKPVGWVKEVKVTENGLYATIEKDPSLSSKEWENILRFLAENGMLVKRSSS